MPNDPWFNAFDGGIGKEELRDALRASALTVIASASIVQSTTLAGYQAISVRGALFWYDASDTTSAHDGVSVLVSSDGRRFKVGEYRWLPWRVDGRQNAPPSSPTIGDIYLVSTAPSGAWASYADHIAIYTVNGWAFIPDDAMQGRSIYVASEDTTYQLTDGGWRIGFGAGAFSDGSLRARHFGVGLIPRFSVENQTTNTPPSSPANGVSYIVGPSPTGAWAGKQTQIASREDGAWAYYPASTGFEVYDKALAANVIWTGSQWLNPLALGQAIPRLVSRYATSTTTPSASGSSSPGNRYSYSDGTAPVASQYRVAFDALELTFAAGGANKKLLFSWQNIDPTALAGDATTSNPVFAVFRDAEASAILWLPCEMYRVSPPSAALFTSKLPQSGFTLAVDGASHVYKLALMIAPNGNASVSLPKNAIFMVQEHSA